MTKPFSLFRRVTAGVVLLVFLFTSFLPSNLVAQQLGAGMPVSAGSLQTIQTGTPVLLRGFRIDAANPLLFDFIVDQGLSRSDKAKLVEEGKRLIKYFLTALTVPSAELWVNLSPYEADRIISDKFGRTEMGRDLLEQDRLLKERTASLLDPNNPVGAEFWKRLNARAMAEFGTVDIPVDTFNKVWIMPDKARVLERGQNVYVVDAQMKVLLEQDYQAMREQHGEFSSETRQQAQRDASAFAVEIMREVIVPELTREINESKSFSLLRQIHYSLVLAAWYEQKLKDSVLGKVFFGRNKIGGYKTADQDAAAKIYASYLETLRKGAYSFIKEEEDPLTQEVLPRKYFSGGYSIPDKSQIVASSIRVGEQTFAAGNLVSLEGGLRLLNAGADAASLTEEQMRDFEKEALSTLKRKLADQGIVDPLSVVYFMGLYREFLAKKSSGVRLLSQIDDESKKRLIWLLEQKGARGLPDELEVELELLAGRFIDQSDADIYILDAVAPEIARVKSLNDIKEEMSGDPETDYRVNQFTSYSLDAGLGTSVGRTIEFLRRWFKREALGSKASDIPVNPEGTPLIAVKMRQLIGVVAGLGTQDINLRPVVNAESAVSYRTLMADPFPADAQARSYAQVLAAEKIAISPVMAPYYPSIDPSDRHTLIETANASGSHGEWWLKILAPLSEKISAMLGLERSRAGMTVFVNNDGPNNHFPQIVLRWMKKNRTPVVMLSTTTTSIDAKGGKFGLRLRKDEKGKLVVERVLLELKSAQLAGQGDEFIRTGLHGGPGVAGRQPFNTNSVAMNAPMLGQILDILFEDVFKNDWESMQKILLPDLIDGEKPFGIQLEGALGTAVLKLHNYIVNHPEALRAIRAKLPNFEQLVTIVNIDTMSDRIRYFTPGKFAIDYFWMFWSNSFRIDRQNFWRHLNEDKMVPPYFHFTIDGGKATKFYEDIGNLMSAFNGVDFSNIHELGIVIRNDAAPVSFPGAKLAGRVLISSVYSQPVDLNSYASGELNKYYRAATGTLELENVEINISEEGKLSVRGIDAGQDVAVSDPVGGIDFALDNFGLNIDSDGQGVFADFDPAQMDNGHFDKVLPEIRRILPITDLGTFLSQATVGSAR